MPTKEDNKPPLTATALSDSEMVQVPVADLAKIQETLASFEKRDTDREAEMAGLRALVESGTESKTPGLKERKNFEPAFRTVRLRKYPIAGDTTNLGYVVGWTDRGAYQKVDTTGISKTLVDYIDIIFLGKERNPETGKLQAESVPLLDLINRSVQQHCKILKTERKEVKVPTGEEIDITMWDPQHGLVQTGDKIDGYFVQSEIQFTIDVPGVGPVEIDGEFVN